MLAKQARESRHGNSSFFKKGEKTPNRLGIHEILGMPNRDEGAGLSRPYLLLFENSLNGLPHFIESHSAEIQFAGIAETEKSAQGVRQRRALAGTARFALEL